MIKKVNFMLHIFFHNKKVKVEAEAIRRWHYYLNMIKI